MNKNTGQLKSCHVPNPDSGWHIITLACQVMSCIAPFHLLNSKRWSLSAHSFSLGWLEGLNLFLWQRWYLDNFLLFICIWVLVTNILEWYTNTRPFIISVDFFLIDEDGLGRGIVQIDTIKVLQGSNFLGSKVVIKLDATVVHACSHQILVGRHWKLLDS